MLKQLKFVFSLFFEFWINSLKLNLNTILQLTKIENIFFI